MDVLKGSRLVERLEKSNLQPDLTAALQRAGDIGWYYLEVILSLLALRLET